MPDETTITDPSRTITLTTDFGLKDPFVGIMKGVIARQAPGINVIDISHDVPPYRPEIGGLWLGLSYRWFASGAVHVAVIDPGVGTERRIACLSTTGHTFLAPDNGLAGEIVAHLPRWSARVVEPGRLKLPVPSTTFHGRDIFAPVAAMLAAGKLRPADLGPPVTDLRPSALPRPDIDHDRIRGEIVLADHFGNLMSNISGPAPPGWASPVAVIGGRTLRLVQAYDEASRGELVAIFNSFGLLEIACPRGSASATADWSPGQAIALRPVR
jgi:S-adenosylmethionine hydrolase